MKTFLKRLTLFLSIQLVIGYVILSEGMKPSKEDNAYLAAIVDKQELMQHDDQPRLILVGGSNVAFGFNSGLLGDRFGLRPVNFGLHAGLGLYFPLNFVEEHVRVGDVVVLSFEYALISSVSIDADPVFVDEMLDYWPGGRKYLGLDCSWKRYMDRQALDRIHHFVKRGRRRIAGSKPPVIPVAYNRRSFNKYGDMTGHHGQPSPGLKPYGGITAIPEKLDLAIARLNEFHRACVDRGATVVYSFPPVPEKLYERSGDTLAAIDAEFRKRLTIPVINSPREMVFATSEFFDTHYHLTQTAARDRSELVVNGLYGDATRSTSIEAGSQTRWR